MRKLIIIFLMLSGSVMLKAQENCKIIFYSEGGEKFKVTVDGELKNESPTTRVIVDNLLSGVAHSVSVQIENTSYGNISKKLYPEPNTTSNMAIKMNRKGKYVLRFMGSVPYSSTTSLPQSNSGSASSATTTTTSSSGNVNASANTNTSGNSESTTVTTTTSTTTNGGTGDNVGVNMNVSVDENTGSTSVTMKVNEGTDGNTSYSETITTTTTTTTTTGDSYVETGHAKIVGDEARQGHKCDYPMDNGDYNDALKSVSSKDFEDSKLTLLKQIIKAQCPTSEQIKGFMKSLTYESSRLDIAKFAYHHCYDKGNYYKVNDAFEFSTSIDELDRYLENVK